MNTPSLVHLGLALASLATIPCVRADVITDWNDIAIPLIRRAPNVTATRQMAVFHVAQFEAVNAVAGKYTPYAINLSAPGASPEAAAVQAAHDILVRYYPAESGALDTSLANSLAKVPEGSAKALGVTLGSSVASQIWSLRASDGSTLSVSNSFPGGPGLYSPTPGAPASPVSQQYAYVTPWALHSASQFRPAPPPALDSEQWATDFNEIKRLGGTNSTERTEEQTDIALFIIEFPFFLLNDALKQVLASRSADLVDVARAFAIMHMASADAGIAVWDGKYAYNFWRPVTAIQHADTDGNDATELDATWLPLRTTPFHPEYPCAHCVISSAMCTALAELFGDDFTFTLNSPTLPGKPRTFHKFSEYASLSLLGRLYAGFHYRNSSVVGLDLGAKVGDWVTKNTMLAGPALAGARQQGQFRVTLKNNGALQQRLEYSADLQKWLPLVNFTRTDLSFEYLDADAAAETPRFYRTVAP